MELFAPDSPYSFRARRGHDFTGHFQCLDIGFYFDHSGSARFTQHTVLFVSVIPIAFLFIFLVAGPKVLSMADCGMGDAVDVGVISEHRLDFHQWFRRDTGGGFIYEHDGYHWFAARQRSSNRASDDFVSDFVLEGRSCGMSAQRIG